MELLKKTNAATPLTVAKIAKIIGVSERTVRYDLNALEDELGACRLVLRKKSQKGIWVEAAGEETKKKTLRDLPQEYIMCKEERCYAIIVAILSRPKGMAIDAIAKRIAVSRSTLLSDLKSVRDMLQECQLQLSSKRGLGIWISGAEGAVRKLLLHIFSRYTYDFKALQEQGGSKRYEDRLLQGYVADLPVGRIYALFMQFVEEKQIMHSEFSVNVMMLALLVQIKRSVMGFSLQKAADIKRDLLANEPLKQNAQYLLRLLEKDRIATFDENELLFTMTQLLSSKLQSAAQNFSEDRKKLVEGFAIAKTFIEYCQVWLSDILLDDEELMYNLALHLQPAIKRAEYGIELTNPLLPKIRQEYGDLFMIALKAVEKIEHNLGIKFSDDEVGYLAIYLGAAIERRKSMRSKKLNVVLVCGNGIGTSSLLAMTLRNRMAYLNITKTVSVRDLDADALGEFDIIISTLPLTLKNETVLIVSPILSEDEITVIEQQLKYVYQKKFPAKGSREQDFSRAISLSDLLYEDMLLLDASAADWEEAVRLAGGVLVRNGGVTKKYVEAMVRCVKEMGPYIVLGNGIAMPHARAEDGAQKVALSVVRLKTPVFFGAKTEEPVDLLFAFASVDERAHLHVMEELWRLFNDGDALEKLRQCRNKEEMLTLLRQYAQYAQQ